MSSDSVSSQQGRPSAEEPQNVAAGQDQASPPEASQRKPDEMPAQPEDQTAGSSAAASPPVETPSETASPSATEPAPVAEGNAEPESASSESAPPADETESSDEAPRRKFQLRPTQSPELARPKPNVSNGGGPGSVAPQASGPVAIPSEDDADVEAEIARAVSGGSPEEMTEDPATPGEPVALPEKENIDDSIAAAVEQALSGSTQTSSESQAEKGPAQPTDVDALTRGQKLQGTVLSVNADSVFLDFGLRLTGVVPFRQFDAKKPPAVGDTLEVVFEQVDENEGLILTNLPRGTANLKGGDWDSVIPGQVVECVVTKTNKGGLETTLSGIRAFIPASQVDIGYVENLEIYVGQKIRAKITEVKPSKKRLVLSRRAILAEEREAAKEELLKELKPDQVRTGKVKTIKDYGAFVDLGGMDGFLPIAQMSWVRIGHPSELIQEGQHIEVKVLSIDTEKNRISLGMRQLAPNPWRLAEDKYAKGTVVSGRVTRVETFGAFVELEPGIEGLVHISELDHRRVRRVTEVLNVDDMVDVQVLEVDPKKKRVSLSVKALKAKPEPVEPPKDEELAPGKGERYQRKRKEPLKGGTGSSKGSGLFGNPQDFQG